MPTGYWKDFIKKQPQVSNPTLAGMNQSPSQTFISEMAQPIEIESGLNAPWYQQAFNRLRGNIQTGTKLNLAQMRKYTGGKGFRPGASGMADTLMAGVAREGSQRLTGAASGLAEMQTREGFNQKLSVEQLNLQRRLGAGGLAMQGEESAMDRLMREQELRVQEELARWQPYWSQVGSSYNNPFAYGG